MMFAEDRESLSVGSMKALKMVFGEIKSQGGAEKVMISTWMTAVRLANEDKKVRSYTERKIQ